jgi:hypothetical protein
MKRFDSPDSYDRNFKYGYIDEAGRIVVYVKYDEVSQFSEGLAAVRIKDEWGYIDRSGRVAIGFRFDIAESFHDGLARTCASKVNTGNVSAPSQLKCGFIDKTGRIVIRARTFQEFSDFSESLAAVQAVNGKYGYVNTRGQTAISPAFTSAGKFSEGLAAVFFSSGSSGYINRNGQTVIKGVSGEAFSGGRARVQKDLTSASARYSTRYGYINRNGNIVIKEQFINGEEFSEGLASVQYDDLSHGYIDKDGKTAIASRFYDADGFHNGLALVITDKKMEVRDKADIEKDEMYVWHVTYYKYAYIDHSGKVLFRWIVPLETPPIAGASGPQPGNDPSPVTVKVSSTPPGARVYFIPLESWEGDEGIIDDDGRLFQYLKAKNSGTVSAPNEFSVHPQVYIVVIKLNGRKDKRRLDANRFNNNEVDITLP